VSQILRTFSCRLRLWRCGFRFVGNAFNTIPSKTYLPLAHLLPKHKIFNRTVPQPNQRHCGRLYQHQISCGRLPCIRVAVPKTHVVHHVGGFIHHEIVLCGHVNYHSKITTPAVPASPARFEPLSPAPPAPYPLAACFVVRFMTKPGNPNNDPPPLNACCVTPYAAR
jgi:hypothetical protein